jgi:TonB family protein
MKIRNILEGKAVAAVVLLTALVCWGFQDNKPFVYKTIHEAAKNGDLADVTRHLVRGADVNSKDKDGCAPLHLAASSGHKDVVELLIAKGADVNAKNKVGDTPLHNAAFNGQKDVAELLIAKGADVNAKDDIGQTPLYEAAGMGSKDVAELLIAKGANVKTASSDGETPLHVAADYCQKDVAELLIAKGADVNAKDKNGRTPLFKAAMPLFSAFIEGQKDFAELLIAKGADVNVKDNNGTTPLQGAGYAGKMEIVELLKKHGARENQPSGSLPSHPPEPESTEIIAPLRIIGDMPKAKIIKKVDPIYPEDARIAKVEGIVIIEATTDEQGKVIDAKILRSVPLLDKAALAAVKQWIFEPYIYAGKPRPAIFTVTVRFSLK